MRARSGGHHGALRVGGGRSGAQQGKNGEDGSTSDGASSCRSRWIIAKSRAPAEAIAFMLIDLHISDFNLTCHQGVSVISMRQTCPVSKLVGPCHAAML